MKIAAALLAAGTAISTVSAFSVNTTALTGNSFKGDILVFKDRLYVPYGPDRVTDGVDPATQPWEGYGYGLGATEHWAYDTKEKYIYSQSESGGYITVIDYNELPGTVTSFGIAVPQAASVDIRDIVVCPEEGLLFVSVADEEKILMYDTVKRAAPAIPTNPVEIEVGNTPDAMKLSNDCQVLAIANQNEGTTILTQGALTLVTNFRDESPTTTRVLLSNQQDDDLLARGVELPITRDSIEYSFFFSSAAPFDALATQYDPAIGFDPEFIAFNNDGTKIFLNLQDNSALAVINSEVGSSDFGTLEFVDGYGPKDFRSGAGVDLVDDGECKLFTNGCLWLSRRPDGIDTVEIDGKDYVFTADEGSDFSIGNDENEWEEKVGSEDLFLVDGSFGFNGMVFDPNEDASCLANFREACNDGTVSGGWCSNFEMTLAAPYVDYSSSTAPVIKRVVGIGGRGISIFEVQDDGIEFIWDSGSDFETETCSAFAWAGNGLQDEDYAWQDSARWTLGDADVRADIAEKNDPAQDGCTFDGGVIGACDMSRTIDEKAQEDGLAVEAVTVGVACNRLVAVGCGENNGMCVLYDVSDVTNPTLLKTFNLSPASRTKNPEQSYQDDLGDVDPETTVFIPKEDSPTGCTGILFGGAISGTLSFYEFECEIPDCCPAGGCKTDSGAALVSFSFFGAGAVFVASLVLSAWM